MECHSLVYVALRQVQISMAILGQVVVAVETETEVETEMNLFLQ